MWSPELNKILAAIHERNNFEILVEVIVMMEHTGENNKQSPFTKTW